MPTPIGFADMTVLLKHVNDDKAWNVTFGVTADLGTASALAHVQRVKEVLIARINPSLDGNVTLDVVGRFGQDGPDDLVVPSNTAPVGGGRTGDSLPSNSSILVQKRSNLGGRKNRGRMYWPLLIAQTGVTETGVALSTTVATLQTAFTNVINDFALGTGGSPVMDMVILHRTSIEDPTTVTSLIVQPLIATQRRRLRR